MVASVVGLASISACTAAAVSGPTAGSPSCTKLDA